MPRGPDGRTSCYAIIALLHDQSACPALVPEVQSAVQTMKETPIAELETRCPQLLSPLRAHAKTLGCNLE